MPGHGGPFLTIGAVPNSAIRGRCSSIVNLLRRSTSVPIADFSKPMTKSPSQPSASPAPTPERSPKRSAAFKPAAAGDCDVNLAIERPFSSSSNGWRLQRPHVGREAPCLSGELVECVAHVLERLPGIQIARRECEPGAGLVLRR